MRLEGSLDAFSLPDIFSLLSMTKKTGGLHLRRAQAHGVVWLGDGLITGGASDLGRLSLGRRLAGSSQISENFLSAAVDEVASKGDLGIARALRDSRAIDEGELHTVVCEHVVDTVFDLMRWPDGVFEFVVDEANNDDVGVTSDVEEVVAEARRRLDIWNAIEDRVAASATVLSLAVDLAVDPQLQRDEWELLALVDGLRTVGDVVNLLGRGEYAVVVALAELVGRGLIRADDSEGVATMARRQDLIASLETDTSAEPDLAPTGPGDIVEMPVADGPTPDVVVAPDSVEESVDVATVDDPAPITASVFEAELGDSDSDDVDAGRQVAEISTIPRAAGVDDDIAIVTPARPEAFIPSRQPEHPEPLAAAMAGGGVVAAPSALIERDPSVNKSLLLRLIAGVRGL